MTALRTLANGGRGEATRGRETLVSVSTLTRRVFAGHPYRITAAAVAALAGLAVFWYLASPLWIRTYTDEALPTGSVAAAPAQATAATAATRSPAGPRVLAMGELGYVDALHNGKGPVRVVDVGGQRFVRFENVAITNAPDVHVYLSRETGGKWSESTSLYLGALKATNGSFNYDVPAAAEIASYRSVVVWCRAFSVLITWADLT
ncbi:MAG TPA: DM13 domain-containing protein [Candidatus Limnocylindria bacterium]|nr:DM13 domain-containing protein [Candidatus Limnocylindria bacterium]